MTRVKWVTFCPGHLGIQNYILKLHENGRRLEAQHNIIGSASCFGKSVSSMYVTSAGTI